jgi:ribosomal protein L6P/L9E
MHLSNSYRHITPQTVYTLVNNIVISVKQYFRKIAIVKNHLSR